MSGREQEAFAASKENWAQEEWARAERYTFTAGWSTEDELLIASAVDIPYAVSHGRTPEEAVHNTVDAAAENPAIIIPEPNGVAV